MLGQFYRKEYLPGYTGHVPYKNDIFGMTAGDINKQLIRPHGAEEFIEGRKVRNPGRKQLDRRPHPRVLRAAHPRLQGPRARHRLREPLCQIFREVH